jgi:FecR protein
MMRTDELKRSVAKAAIIVACALLPAISSASQDTDAMNADHATGSHVYVVKGSVYVAQGKNPAHRVSNNETIVSDSVITTVDNSAALLRFEDGQIVTMQSNSTFRVREYRYDAKKAENSSIIFSMLKGGMRFVTGLIGQQRKQAFRLLTPNATLGIRGTEFMAAMVDGSLYSQVQSGKISMTNKAGMTILDAGKSAVVPSSGALVSVVSASAIPVGTFSELISIPLIPSAIPAPVPAPAAVLTPILIPAPVPPPAPISLPEPPVEIATQAVEPPAEVTIEKPVVQGETEDRSGAAVTAKIGTLGFGVELDMSISDSIGARVGINAGTYYSDTSRVSSGYDSNIQLQTASALADWYPFQGSFRASGGVFYNGNNAILKAIPVGGFYDVNGVQYPATGITDLQGKLSFNTIAPYVGIGWGNPVAKNKGWGLTTDFGVLFQGNPRVDMSATCSLGAGCAAFDASLEAERATLENDLSNFTWWPVASIGITYQW